MVVVVVVVVGGWVPRCTVVVSLIDKTTYSDLEILYTRV